MLTVGWIDEYNVRYGLPKDITFNLRFKVPFGVDNQVSETGIARRNWSPSESHHTPGLCRTGRADFKWSDPAGSRPFVGIGTPAIVSE